MDETLAVHVRALQCGGARAVRAAKALYDLDLLCESDLIEDKVALIVAAGAIPPLVALVRNGSDYGKKWAACALANLAIGDIAAQPIADAGGIAALVELLRDGSDDGKMRAAHALANLACNGDVAAQSIVDAGGIAALFELLRDGSDDGQKQAARALWNLTSNADAYDAMIAEAGAIEQLVELERNGSDDAKEHATRALDTIAFNSDFEAAVAAARRRVAPAVEPSTEPPNLTTCIACEDAARSVVFLPCAHACFCTSCAASHRAMSAQCPICRTAITGSVAFRLA
jgi:vacuolar protein 8